MNLPILTNIPTRPDDATLVRLAYKCELDDARSLGEESLLDYGIAIVSPTLGRVHDANRLFDASVLKGISVEQAVGEVDAFYAARGSRCWKWVPNISAPLEQTVGLIEYLLDHGYTRNLADVMRLEAFQRPDRKAPDDLRLIPARASFRHAKTLADYAPPGEVRDPQLAYAQMLRLDDPQYDQIIAIKDGVAVGCAGVRSAGEVGMIDNVFVVPDVRRRGVASVLLSHLIDQCARSLFKHVLLTVRPDNEAALALYARFGFRKVGEFVEYVAPASDRV